MSRPLESRWLAAVLAVAATAAACGPGGSAGAPATPSGGDGRTPDVGATSTPGAGGPTATPAPVGAGQATVRIGDAETVISGGKCGVFEFPADLGGGYGFSLNLGRMNSEDGGPDYLGLVIDVPGMGAEADGTYEMTWSNATGTLVAASRYTRLGDIVLTIASGGASGSITSVVRDEDTPVEITFTC